MLNFFPKSYKISYPIGKNKQGGNDKMEEERDLVTFSDDEGNEFELEVIDYFDYEDQEYAILMDPADEENAEDENCETEIYIMKVVINGEYEEFLPADDDKMDELSAIAEERLCCDCEECDDDCDCGCCCHEHEEE